MRNESEFQQLQFFFSPDVWLIISSSCIDNTSRGNIISDNYCGCTVSGIIAENENENHLMYKEEDSGFYNFQIEETIKYTIQVSSGTIIEELSDLGLKRITENVFSLQVINFLGKSAISVSIEGKKYKIDFEIISNKIDYKKDYISLTENIAHCCSQLLLDYSSAANLSYELDEKNNSKTLLEQFLFIREFCSVDNIEYIMSAVINNPDRTLESEIELKPYGLAPIAQSFYSNPFSNSKNWRIINNRFIPEFVTTKRKFDSFDTPANRFIKFALNTFLSICEQVELSIDTKGENFYQREARCLKENLELFLSNSFFDDIQELEFMPLNNQVLQKREGYNQILNAFNMLDIALKLNWPGKNKIYSEPLKFEGEVKNTALLYEYWLFFEIFNILKDLSEDIPINDMDADAFISSKNGRLLLSLNEGQTSRISFKIKNSQLNVNLYYNKTFPKKVFNHIYENSYSRDFRPDYSLEFFKGDYNRARINGQISYVHFDAKYRLTDITSWFTCDNMSETEKKEETINTYKRGDLLKMHTYNDAIRRTLGSYVLYPGNNSDKSVQFNIYDELLPGVGAFAIKPSNHIAGENALKIFIKEIISFQENESTREKRIRFHENNILNYVSAEKTFIPMNNNLFCMIGLLRNDYYKWLINNNFINNEGKTFYFYFQAIIDGNVISLNPNIHKATYFCGYLTEPKETEKLVLENWISEIGETQLVNQEILKSKLKSIGFDPENSAHKLNADFYYLIELKNIKKCKNIILNKNNFDKLYGNYAESKYSPFVCTLNDLNI